MELDGALTNVQLQRDFLVLEPVASKLSTLLTRRERVEGRGRWLRDVVQ